jgi:hypothetical protein
LGDTNYTYGLLARDNHARRLNDVILRGRFYRMPFNTNILNVAGQAVIYPGHYTHPEGPAGWHQTPITRRSFTTATMVEVDGATVQAVYFATVAPGIVSTMMNPRVFSDFMNLAPVQWNEATRSMTFSGYSTAGVYQTVVLTLDNPVAMVNGQPVDIATGSAQPQLAGAINPVVNAGRSFVPARFLANIFGVPIDFQAGTVILG